MAVWNQYIGNPTGNTWCSAWDSCIGGASGNDKELGHILPDSDSRRERNPAKKTVQGEGKRPEFGRKRQKEPALKKECEICKIMLDKREVAC